MHRLQQQQLPDHSSSLNTAAAWCVASRHSMRQMNVDAECFTSAVGSMPVLTTSAPMSESTASIWSDRCWVGTVWTPLTPFVFWAVKAEMAEVPKTPLAWYVLRSA